MQIKRPNAKTFRDLLVWRKAHEFVLRPSFSARVAVKEVVQFIATIATLRTRLGINCSGNLPVRQGSDQAREGSMHLRLCLLAVCVILAAPDVYAQGNATIVGIVSDTSGGVAPGAEVTLTNE